MKLFLILVILTLIGPVTLLLTGTIDFKADYRTADRASAQLAPDPKLVKEAVVQVYSARAFNWRGIFAVHTWLALKKTNAPQYIVYQTIGWRLFRGLQPIVVIPDIPDRKWFDQNPKILLDIRGQAAEQLISKLGEIVQHYPYSNRYKTWPGPNSNTFIAYIGRQLPKMRLVMPSNAVGKDYIGFPWLIRAVSGTGFQLSIYGLFGITVALEEGLEVNILGLVYGISPLRMTLKLPGFGDLSLRG